MKTKNRTGWEGFAWEEDVVFYFRVNNNIDFYKSNKKASVDLASDFLAREKNLTKEDLDRRLKCSFHVSNFLEAATTVTVLLWFSSAPLCDVAFSWQPADTVVLYCPSVRPSVLLGSSLRTNRNWDTKFPSRT